MPKPAFKRVGGHLAADFVNTVHGRVSADGHRRRDYADRIVADKLTAFADLVAWAVESGTISPAEARRWLSGGNRGARGALARAIQYREALYRVCKAAIEGWPPRPADLAAVAAMAEAARSAQRLSSRGGRLQWDWPPVRNRDRIVWPVALAATELLTGPDRARLRQCPGDRCGWLFVDHTRNHSRRWCDMRDCGNLAKVRRFRGQSPRGRRAATAGSGR
jgi:predicted RNA-binding Zn ribbon-like protein